jgi:hypothetical protein
MPDRISNYRQVRLILNPWEGDWNRAYWSVHFLTVKQGIPRSEVAADGLVRIDSLVPTQDQFWSALADVCLINAGRGTGT